MNEDRYDALLKKAFPDRPAQPMAKRMHGLTHFIPKVKMLKPVFVRCMTTTAEWEQFEEIPVPLVDYAGAQQLCRTAGAFLSFLVGWGDGVITAGNMALTEPAGYHVKLVPSKESPGLLVPMMQIHLRSFTILH